MLHYLHGAGFKKLIVCHLDHSLRGRQSTADANFVRRLAERYDLPSEIAKTDVRALAKNEKLSIEAAARQARHEFFAELSKTHSCKQIFLGHHADDAAETTILNLFRGSSGLTQISSPAEIRIGRRTLTFLRPLLTTRRSEIDTYCDTNRLKFREDASNQSNDHLRNRIRHQVVPLLGEVFDRDITKTVNRASLIAAEEDAYLNTLLQGFDLSPRDQPSALSTTKLEALPLTLQRRAIHTWLRENRVPRVSFEKVEECLSLLDKETSPAKINLPGNLHARRKNKAIFIEG